MTPIIINMEIEKYISDGICFLVKKENCRFIRIGGIAESVFVLYKDNSAYCSSSVSSLF